MVKASISQIETTTLLIRLAFMTEDNEDLVPVFVPALITLLVSAEDNKGSPLDYDEVIEIRDSGACIMMEAKDVAAMAESRGYADIDPENCWYDWQMARRELGRKPDIDPGVSMVQIKSSDPEFQETIKEAKNSLDQFRKMLPQNGDSMYEAMVKMKFTDGEASSFMWLFNVRMSGDKFVAELFEVPEYFTAFNVGDTFEVSPDELVDWSVNLDGTLYGGYSIRYQRAQLPEHEKEAFDNYVGVKHYAD